MKFSTFAGISAIISAPLALVNVIGAMALNNFNPAVFSSSAVAQTMVSEFPRWVWWLDTLGFYLLLVPILVYLYSTFSKSNKELAATYSIAGTLYFVAGIIGASIIAALWSLSESVSRETFILINEIVFREIWGFLGIFCAAIWWLGMGSLMKKRWKKLGWFTIVLGVVCSLGFIGRVGSFILLTDLGVTLYLFIAPIWAFVTGVVVLKNPLSVSEQ